MHTHTYLHCRSSHLFFCTPPTTFATHTGGGFLCRTHGTFSHRSLVPLRSFYGTSLLYTTPPPPHTHFTHTPRTHTYTCRLPSLPACLPCTPVVPVACLHTVPLPAGDTHTYLTMPALSMMNLRKRRRAGGGRAAAVRGQGWLALTLSLDSQENPQAAQSLSSPLSKSEKERRREEENQ